MMNSPFNDLLDSLDSFLISFNSFCQVFFSYLKWITGGIFIILGILTLMKLRAIYLDSRLRKIENEVSIKNPKFLVGFIYLIIGAGILLNFVTYFLIFILDPLLDRFFFSFIQFPDSFDAYYVNSLYDIENLTLSYQKSIYYGLAIFSFVGFMEIFVGIYLIINKTQQNTKRIMVMIISGLFLDLFFGFTTFLPLLL